MKRKLVWWLSAILLYFSLAIIIFIALCLSVYIFMIGWLFLLGLNGAGESAGYGYFLVVFLMFIGMPFSLFAPFLIVPFILSSIRTKRQNYLKKKKLLSG